MGISHSQPELLSSKVTKPQNLKIMQQNIVGKPKINQKKSFIIKNKSKNKLQSIKPQALSSTQIYKNNHKNIKSRERKPNKKSAKERNDDLSGIMRKKNKSVGTQKRYLEFYKSFLSEY